MTGPDVLDWVARVLATGTLGIAGWFGRQKFRSWSARRRDRVGADVEEATAPDKIRSSSITTMEAQVVAMDRAFAIERAATGRTIDFLQRDNEDLRAQVDAKDLRLREALAKIDALQQQLTELAEQVRAEVAHNSDDRKTP